MRTTIIDTIESQSLFSLNANWRVVKEIKKATCEFRKVEAIFDSSLDNTSETKNDNGHPGMPKIVQTDGDEYDNIDELKSVMVFNSLDNLYSYNK